MNRLDTALGSLLKKAEIRMHERKSAEGMEDTERAEPARKPLPLLDEEELAGMQDPVAREHRRKWYESHYEQFPNSRMVKEELTKKALAEREKEKNKVVMLTPWLDSRRAAPNVIFRSALFPVLNNKQGRSYLENHKVYSVGGIEVTFTGKQFDQTDLDVYLEILHIAQEKPIGYSVKFSAHSMLKSLGWANGGKDHKRLHAHLIRLCAGVIDATDHKTRYFGHLILGGSRDEITNEYEITFNRDFASLFGFGMWSSLDLKQRRELERNGTAKALHAYYSTHAAPALHRYDTLAGIAGLEGKNKTAVKNSLIKAHEELLNVGFLASFEAKRNGIEVVINMTEGQQRNAIKKIAKAADPV